MNLIKWLRKNNMKIMAVVIIVLMIGFVGGSYIQQLTQKRKAGLHNTVAHFLDNNKITNYDRVVAQRELEILRELGANTLLSSQQDLQMVLLSELLFSERGASPAFFNHIKQLIRAKTHEISDKQINDIYTTPLPRDIYWLLLKSEAQQVGIKVSNKVVGDLLGRITPQVFPGITYQQKISLLINRYGLPEEDILAIYGNLLGALEYAKMTCSSEDITDLQIMQIAALEQEKINAEFIRFSSDSFVEAQEPPSEDAILEHFDKYRKFPAGAISEENPYGFGYKLPDRVQLEYIAIKLDDVSGIVTPPTQEETEEYYQENRGRFVERILSDPNDPNSPAIERTKSYAEMAEFISKGLLQQKVNSQAERILQEAKTLTEANADYKSAAEQLSKKYNIKAYAGQTGLLNAADIQTDKHLGSLYVQSQSYTPLGMTRLLFAIDELGTSELGPFDTSKPKMHENIGPLRDLLGQIAAIIRITKVEKSSEPEDTNYTYSKTALKIDQGPEPESEDIYSTREKVIEDIKKLTAINTAKAKAEEFTKKATEDGWDSAIEKLNTLYEQTAKKDEAAPDTLESIKKIIGAREPFKLEALTDRQKISRGMIEALVAQSKGRPASQLFVNEVKKQKQFLEQLYSLVPQGAETLDTVPLIMEFKPDMSYYCIKSISVKRLEQQEYQKTRAMQAYKRDADQSQLLAAVHFNPENILKRTNFRSVREKTEVSDANVPARTKEAL